MNCLESRREILVDPRRLGDEVRTHLEGCAACAQFRSDSLQLDERIHAGFSVAVPQGLAGRIARNAIEESAGTRRRFLAVAASLVLATAAGTGAWVAGRDDPLARAGIDFVVDEEVNAILRSKPSDPSVLAKVARALQVEIPRQAGEVRYIGICPFQGTVAHHVVIMSPEGKATLLLFPERPVGEKAHASARGLRAVVLPAGAGSLAIIAESSSLRRIEQAVARI